MVHLADLQVPLQAQEAWKSACAKFDAHKSDMDDTIQARTTTTFHRNQFDQQSIQPSLLLLILAICQAIPFTCLLHLISSQVGETKFARY